MTRRDIGRAYTVAEINDSLTVLEWIREHAPDPLEHQDHAPILPGILRPWQALDSQAVRDELVRAYAYRQN